MPLGPCFTCGVAAKYRCPRCSVESCSLKCVTAHKSGSGCTGLIDPSEAVALSCFNDRQLRRDFLFLEDCQRSVDVIARSSDFDDERPRQVPKAVLDLREAAKDRGVVCQFLSEGMAKRTRNTSRYDAASDTYTWHVLFRFVTEGGEFDVHSHWGNERFTLQDLVAVCWAPQPPLTRATAVISKGPSRADEWLKLAKSELQEDATSLVAAPTSSIEAPDCDDQEALLTKERVERFLSKCKSAGPQGGYLVAVRSERVQTTSPTYLFINPALSVHQAVRRIFFVCEFPEFYIVPFALIDRFPRTSFQQLVKLRESFRKVEPSVVPKKGKRERQGTGVCKFISSPGGCVKGESCPFVHPLDH